MAVRRRWSDISPRNRRLIVIGATGEGLLKAAAITDLIRRPAADVRGRKAAWGVALVLVNSLGALPAVYFRYGRRPSHAG